MQHVIYHFRNKSCLRLGSLKVLSLTPVGEGGSTTGRTRTAVQMLLDNLNRRYSGYEPQEVQAIPVLQETTSTARHSDALAVAQFLHVAQYLLEETHHSPLLGFSYDDMLPVVRIDWETLQRTTGIVSLYMDQQPQVSVNSTTLVGAATSFLSLQQDQSVVKRFVVVLNPCYLLGPLFEILSIGYHHYHAMTLAVRVPRWSATC